MNSGGLPTLDGSGVILQGVNQWLQEVNRVMAIHEEILATARRLCITRRTWTFTPVEVVRALPHLNERSVRTHIVSRCCINAPAHHAHRWPYFERLGRGVYEIRKEHREAAGGSDPRPEASFGVAEAAPAYETHRAIHAVVSESEGLYVAECLEVAIVTQGASLDETLANLREALDLYVSGEDCVRLGLAPEPRLSLTFETSARSA